MQIFRLIRLPTFRFFAIGSFIASCLFLAWSFLDAQYTTILVVVRYTLGFDKYQPSPMVVDLGLWDMMWDGIRSWDSLGPRLVIFLTLSVLFALCLVATLIQYFRQITIRRSLVVMALFSFWLSFLVSYDKISIWANKYRATHSLYKFESAVESLADNWPIANGTMGTRKYFAYPNKYPNLLLLPGRIGYPFNEDIGYKIEKSDLGAIKFNLAGAGDYQIEYHPVGSEPKTYKSQLGENNIMNLINTVKIKENWYLARYGAAESENAR